MKESEAERKRRIQEYLAAERQQLEEEERELAKLWAQREAEAEAKKKKAEKYVEAEDIQFEQEVRETEQVRKHPPSDP
jgi:hypothetical protein